MSEKKNKVLCIECGKELFGDGVALLCGKCYDKHMSEKGNELKDVIKLPITFESGSGMFFDADNNHIADIRGWGWIQYKDSPQSLQDNIGELIAVAINETRTPQELEPTKQPIDEGEIESIVYGFMGWCGVRYSMDQDLALSDDDINEVNRVVKAISSKFSQGEI